VPKAIAPVAMILAAGRGERMRPLTDRVPKALLSVGGKPLIFWHLEKLASAGFKRVVINHAHLGDQIEAAVGDGSRWQLAVLYSREPEALETAGGLRNAQALLDCEAFAVVNADVYSSYAYAGLPQALSRLTPGGRQIHLVLVDNPPHHPRGDFGIREGQAVLHSETLLTFGGLSAFRTQVFEQVPQGQKQALAPLLREHIARGQVSAEHYRGLWIDVGTPQRLAELDTLLLRSDVK
jgi:N-acetyl-alpha-D-muramate 1-phosphate uridylyltransferase